MQQQLLLRITMCKTEDRVKTEILKHIFNGIYEGGQIPKELYKVLIITIPNEAIAKEYDV